MDSIPVEAYEPKKENVPEVNNNYSNHPEIKVLSWEDFLAFTRRFHLKLTLSGGWCLARQILHPEQ